MMGPARYESQERNESPAAMGAAAGHRWLRRVAGGCGKTSRRLIFFPYAGGDEAPAMQIAECLPVDTEVWAVSLPGSGRSLGGVAHTLVDSAAAIASSIICAALAGCRRRFSITGNCSTSRSNDFVVTFRCPNRVCAFRQGTVEIAADRAGRGGRRTGSVA